MLSRIKEGLMQPETRQGRICEKRKMLCEIDKIHYMEGEIMKALLEKMIHGLRNQVEEKVPDKGVFTVVYEREDVSGMHIGLSHLILKVTNVGVPGHEDKRYLELGAVNHPSPYGAGCVMGYGTTQDILVRLQDVQLLEDLMKKVPKLIEDIEYEEMHPYG